MTRLERTVIALGRTWSADKVVQSNLLNALGLQVLRVLAARLLYSLRPTKVDDAVSSAVSELKREGLLLLPDFLSPDQFAGVLRECEALDQSAGQMFKSRWGPNHLEVIRLSGLETGGWPCLRQFFEDRRLSAILQAAEKSPLTNLTNEGGVEHLTQGQVSSIDDPQTRLHSDVFFHSHKVWLYLDDVQVEDGPLVYVRRSHRLSLARLAFIYRESYGRHPSDDPSRRISREELDQLGVPETIVTARKNTLAIVNVSGFHRRLQGAPGRTRHALALTLRDHPFAPRALRVRWRRHFRG